MHMIRHDDKGMQQIPIEPPFAFPKAAHNERSNDRVRQVPWPGSRAVQQPVHRDERFSVGDGIRSKQASRRKAAMQPKSDEKWLSHDIPMR